MPLLLVKIALTPLLMVACTLVARRWGSSASGWLLGLPVISGPVSVFLLAEHGQRFAVSAAQSTLTGFIAAGAFCVCYAITSVRRPLPVSLGASFAAFLGTAWLIAPLHLDWLRTGIIVVAVLGLLARTVEPPANPVSAPRLRKREVTAQIALSCGIVVVLTAVAGDLGPHIAGLLAPLPVISTVMATASIRSSGAGAANELLRGAVVGSWGGAAFFAVVGATMTSAGPVAAYAAATAAALLGGSLGFRLQRARAHAGRGAFSPAR